MSQAGILTPPGGGGGGIDIRTITGNDAVAVGPNLAHNLTLIGADGITVTNTAANTLTITGTSITAVLTTNDAVETAIFTLTVSPNTAVVIKADIVGARDDFSTSVWGTVTYGATRQAGAAIVIGVPQRNLGREFGVTAEFDAITVGNDIEITVTGEALTTWNWTATITYTVQS